MQNGLLGMSLDAKSQHRPHPFLGLYEGCYSVRGLYEGLHQARARGTPPTPTLSAPSPKSAPNIFPVTVVGCSQGQLYIMNYNELF